MRHLQWGKRRHYYWGPTPLRATMLIMYTSEHWADPSRRLRGAPPSLHLMHLLRLLHVLGIVLV